MSRHHRSIDRRRWQRTRRQVFDRDGWRCRGCGKAGRLECDHVTPLHADPDQEYYAAANCQALCRSCHLTKTRRENKERSRLLLPPPVRRWRDLVDATQGGA